MNAGANHVWPLVSPNQKASVSIVRIIAIVNIDVAGVRYTAIINPWDWKVRSNSVEICVVLPFQPVIPRGNSFAQA